MVGWFGGMVGVSIGKDIVLYFGEGIINIIKWFLLGKYVVWLNEYGIKIMCIKFYLESVDVDDVWKCIGYIDWF